MSEFNVKKSDVHRKGEYLLEALGENNFFDIVGERVDKVMDKNEIVHNSDILEYYGDIAVNQLYQELVGSDIYKTFGNNFEQN